MPPANDLWLEEFVGRVSGYAILTLDAGGRIRSWNDGARRVKGWTAEEIIGEPYARFFTPEDAADGLPDRILARVRDTGHHEGEGWRVRKDGTRFWAHVDITAIRDGDGRLLGYGKITEDLSDKRAAAEALADRAAELERYAYVVSHDLAEPLRSIAGFSRIVARRLGDDLDPQVADGLARIQKAATRMQALIDDLLTYSRADRGAVRREPVELDEVLAGALEALHATIEARGAVVRAGPLPRVTGDAGLLGQLLQNLVSNAIKFSEGVPEVEVSAAPDGDGWRLTVADRGIGIDPEQAARALALFERVHQQAGVPGTGIGLAICQRVAERHGGRLWLEAREGGGTAAHCTLR